MCTLLTLNQPQMITPQPQIGVLHGNPPQSGDASAQGTAASGGFASLATPKTTTFRGPVSESEEQTSQAATQAGEATPLISLPRSDAAPTDWTTSLKGLLLSFILSGTYTLCTFFVPLLRNLPVFGSAADRIWLWNLNPSPAYIGQGIIMGPETTMHSMYSPGQPSSLTDRRVFYTVLLGAFVGWGILSPLAKFSGWAPGPVSDWETGSKGWIVWVSLAIMLADAVVSLGFLAASTLWRRRHHTGIVANLLGRFPSPKSRSGARDEASGAYSAIPTQDHNNEHGSPRQPTPWTVAEEQSSNGAEPWEDAPPGQQVSNKTVVMGLISSIVLCVGTVHAVFGSLVPLYANILAVAVALLLSIMGVRALGETDLNPVSGISKLAQLFFALLVPQGHRSSVLINLVAGAVVSLSIGIHFFRGRSTNNRPSPKR